MAAEGRQQLRPGDAGKAQVVLHPFRLPERAVLHGGGEQQHGLAPDAAVDGGAEARRAAAHDEDIIAHAPTPFLG